MHEQLSGLTTQLDEARQVGSFRDLLKFSSSEPRAVRAVYSFNDLFEALVFGQSLFVSIEDDDRVHHKFFCGASTDRKTRLFEAWLSALKGAHYRVLLRNSTAALLFWLSRETSAPPEARELAREWFGVRLPSSEQTSFARALFEGWLLNHKDWALWEFVGRATRTLPDSALLERSTEQLRDRFPRIDVFHRQVASSFLRPVTDHGEFEPARHRQFVSARVDQLLNCVSDVAALTIEENLPRDAACVVAKFRDSILCSGKAKAQLVEPIDAKLQ